MTQSILNYFFEANLALCVFLLFYVLLLQKETSFSAKRLILLGGIAASLLLPAIHLRGGDYTIPAIRDVLPTTILPEVLVSAEHNAIQGGSPISPFTLLQYTYLAGAGVSLSFFMMRLSRLAVLIKSAVTVKREDLYIAESEKNMPSFSFFNFIYIGQSQSLCGREKEQIIAHESVHARQLHSLDILVLNVIGIFFWFNPVVKIYKNIFIQLHEFEADARSVRMEEMNEYCSLLARVALLSADIRIANHFSNSLTLKRIQMMRTIKSTIRPWKVAAIAVIVPTFFVTFSCQDQLMSDATEVAKSSTVALEVPDDVKRKYDELSAANPGKQFLLVEVDEKGQAKLESMKQKMDQLPSESISSVNVIKIPATEKQKERAFIIVEYSDDLRKIQEGSKNGDDVYTMVEQTAMPAEGMEKFYQTLSESILYPKQSREQGVEGKVFVSFIVELDGSLSDVKVAKGVDELLNAEALRVVTEAGKWTPGRNNGKPVRQRLILPINFSLGDNKAEPKKVG